MPRSPAEATRFTSTGPHAGSKNIGSTISLSTPPPPNETPIQKVARLREAARRAKIDQETTWDRVVSRGRVWADRAHRVTASVLIGSSIIAAGFAALSLGEQMLANRAKKSNWYKEQEENYQKALALAKKAEADGTLTENLRMFLVKQRAIEQAEAEKANQGSLWSRAKDTVYGGLSMEEKPGGSLRGVSGSELENGSAVPRQAEIGGISRGQKTEQLSPEVMVDYDEPAELKAADQIRKQLSTPLTSAPRGGPLDQLAQQNATSIAESSKRWFGWGSQS